MNSVTHMTSSDEKSASRWGKESAGNNALLRGDDALYSDVRTNGIPKSYINNAKD